MNRAATAAVAMEQIRKYLVANCLTPLYKVGRRSEPKKPADTLCHSSPLYIELPRSCELFISGGLSRSTNDFASCGGVPAGISAMAPLLDECKKSYRPPVPLAACS